MAFNIQELQDQYTGSSGIDIRGQIDTNPGGVGTTGTGATPESLYYNAVDIFLIALSIVAVLVLIYGGFKYLTSAGDANQAESGKKAITGAIIGIIIILASFIFYGSSVNILQGSGTKSSDQIQQELDRDIK